MTVEEGRVIADASRIAPSDYRNPDWDGCIKYQDWKNYASEWLRESWSGMSDEHKRAVAATLDDIASKEEWE